MSLGYHGDTDYKAIGDVWNTGAERPFASIGADTALQVEWNRTEMRTRRSLPRYALPITASR
ncbi:MAG: hypothetical protein IPM12_12215 [Flavobacteriales bacterium]|nr:hypothetical protein [Flavobacteriales bacterium]